MCYEDKGCIECDNGDVYICYKNEKGRTIRKDYVHCSNCYPDSKSNSTARLGEEEITSSEFNQLLNKSWNEID